MVHLRIYKDIKKTLNIGDNIILSNKAKKWLLINTIFKKRVIYSINGIYKIKQFNNILDFLNFHMNETLVINIENEKYNLNNDQVLYNKFVINNIKKVIPKDEKEKEILKEILNFINLLI